MQGALRHVGFDKKLPFVRGDLTIFIAVGLQEGLGIAIRIMGFKLLPFDDTITVVIDFGEGRGIAGEGSTGRQQDGGYYDRAEFTHHYPWK